MTLSDLRPEMRPYRPYGRALEVLYDKSQEVLVSGPAGTGKSRAILEKIHLCCEKYPGCRWLILRKTRASVSEAALVTYETKVVPAGHPVLDGAQRGQRQHYVYPNGSEIIVGGLDKPGKVMSTEYDGAYIQEAIEVTENDWESVTTRLRNGVMPYQQILGDTNPDKPTHWLIQRCNRGQTRILESRHEDNPEYWDLETGDYTPKGREYIVGKLEKLTGARLQRLRYGKWVAAEGLVYEGWDTAKHLIDRRPIPEEWERLWIIDFGYTNPFVWQEWAVDPDGRLYRCLEIYKTRRLVEDHAREILRATKDRPIPRAIICDHDAEDRATLEKWLGLHGLDALEKSDFGEDLVAAARRLRDAGLTSRPARKTVSDGIQAVQARLRTNDDGKPRIFYMRDALLEIDKELEESRKPTCTEQEYDGYVWDIKEGKKIGEEPVKKDDHGMDTTRYAVAFVDMVRRQVEFSLIAI